jgi:hypothetical protein
VAITDSILALKEKEEQQAPQNSWVQELITTRYQPQQQRKKRNPVGFNFERDPFNPESFYRSLNTFKDVQKLATGVTLQEAANKEEAQRQREYERSQAAFTDALGNVNPNFTYSDGGGGSWQSSESRRYKLGGVSKAAARAADYFGNKYGITSIGGYREHGSVPGSDHPKGRALDFMTNNVKGGKKRGDALANDLIRNYKKYNVKYVIWYRYIWSPGRGWRKYNGPSAHTDHVHASFNK